MSTVRETALGVLAAVDSKAGLVLASKWVTDRYTQLCARTRFRHLRKVGEINIPAEVSTGTVTATRGSKTIIGDSAAQAVWTADIVGRHIRMTTTWYEIANLSEGEIRLTSDFSEDSVSAVAYKIVQRYLTLDKAVRWLGAFMHMRRRIELDRYSLAQLDAEDPARPSIGPGPNVYAEIGTDVNGARLIEVYPYSTEEEIIHYAYWALPPTLKAGDFLPPQVDEFVLREGALIDAMRYNAAKAANAVQIEAAAYWRNEYRAQSTSWERTILNAIRADKGTDDKSFLLKATGNSTKGLSDIQTARDEIYARGARP